MGFLSLYRKYRPHSFKDLVGQKAITQTLKNALHNKRIAHAYLFAGPRGTGKTSTAKVFAQALNCVNGPTVEPCGVCDNCQKIISGQSLDVIEIDAASNRGIDEIRDLREKVRFYPSEGCYKVYIIDEVHMLTKGAFNALLKTLEEPPESVVFILATTEPHKIIETILSRCQRFDFSLLSVSDIQKRLVYICQQEEVIYEKEALYHIALSSNGGLRDAISLLDQAISYTNANLTSLAIQKMLGKVDKKVLNQFIEHIINNDSAAALELVNQLLNRGNNIFTFVNQLIDHFRQLLLIKECGLNANILEYPKEILKNLEEESNKIDSIRLIRLIEILVNVQRNFNYTDQPRLILEVGIVKMSSPEADNSLQGLQSRVAELEYRLRKSSLNDLDKFKGEKIETKEKEPQKISNIKELAEEGSFTLDEVTKAWTVILNRIKENNIKAQAYLREGKPQQIKGNILFIQFPHDKGFHKKGAESEIGVIKKIITEVLGKSCQLKFILEGDKEEVVKKKVKLQEEENLVDKIVKLFDGEIIKVDYDILSDEEGFK